MISWMIGYWWSCHAENKVGRRWREPQGRFVDSTEFYIGAMLVGYSSLTIWSIPVAVFALLFMVPLISWVVGHSLTSEDDARLARWARVERERASCRALHAYAIAAQLHIVCVAFMVVTLRKKPK